MIEEPSSPAIVLSSQVVIEEPSSPAMIEVPSSQVVIEEPSSPAMIEVPSSQVVIEEPSSPAMIEVPSSSAMIEVPSSPAMIEVPSSPAMIEVPSSPAMIEEPSSPAVIKEPSSPIVMEETESYTKTTIGQETTVTKDKCVKVLGVLWDTENDTFMFEFSSLVQYARSLPATKRSVLKVTSKIFDPVGFLTPFVIKMKALFQELCVE
ncbi:Hypothetical predicted protein, partial [Paramuricea clavata]